MLEKKIKYTDYNGVEREETFYFHISKAEMSRKEFTTAGGYSEYLQKIVDERDSIKLYNIFEDLLRMSFGVKSDDGKRFIKKASDGSLLFDQFQESPAYDELIMELFNPEETAKFIKGIFPKDIVDQVDERELQQKLNNE